MISVKIKLDGPLQFDLKLDRAIAAREFSEAAPKGAHPHDPPGWVTKRGTRPRRGDKRLSNYLGKPQNWNPGSKATHSKKLYCNVFLAYAWIIDQGGTIPPVHFKYALKIGKKSNRYKRQIMTWQSGGSTVFAVQRRGYTIKGQGYVAKGAERFFNSKGIDVSWAKGSPETL